MKLIKEKRIPKNFQASKSDYFAEKAYTKRQMAVPFNHQYSLHAFEQTFILTNIAPQVNRYRVKKIIR